MKNKEKNLDQILQKTVNQIHFNEILNPITYPLVLKLIILLMIALYYFHQQSLVTKTTETLSNKTAIKSTQDKQAQISHIQPLQLDDMIKKLNSRKLFKEQEKPKPKPKPKKRGPGISEKIRPFVLLGVIEGNPKQAIIESKKNRETYYLTEGDLLDDMEIISIAPGSVTLIYQGEKKDLR